jgi:hypothetical protein
MKAGSIIGRQGNCEPAPLAASSWAVAYNAIAELTTHGVFAGVGRLVCARRCSNVFARRLLYPLKFQVWDEWTLG